MRTNVPKATPPRFTHEGGEASKITAEQELRRLTTASMLWENNFYESGVAVADRIAQLVPLCRPEYAAACAYEARTKMKLRHTPLHIVREMARATPAHRLLVGRLLADVIQRADELSEFVAIYWKDGKQALSAQAKKGLARAFPKFDEYQLAKYNRDNAVKLRDVLFLCHAKPTTPQQEELWKRLIDGTLATPDTWEVELSAGKDKRQTFERLMAENNLGDLAFLRNLRNMNESGVEKNTIRDYGNTLKFARTLPFRFISAARAVPAFEDIIEPWMLRAVEGRERLLGTTVVVVDVSGSMRAQVSSKSDITRLDAAAGVAILLREVCERVEIFTFSDDVRAIPPRRGFALRDAIGRTRGGTQLGKSLKQIQAAVPNCDRIVVITDEQSSDKPAAPWSGARGYIINVADHQNGVGYGAWTHINGWSEAVIDYLQAYEQLQ